VLNPPTWSPDGRYLAANTARGDDVVLVNVRRAARRHFESTFYGGVAFSPNSTKLAFSAVQSSGGALSVVGVSGGTERGIADGFGPAWGVAGIAFATSDAIYLKRSPRTRQQLLLRAGSRNLLPIDWSEDGKRLLVVDRLSGGGTKALLLDRQSRRFNELPQTVSRVYAIARDGRSVLGRTAGDVVAVDEAGTLHRLAVAARAASWTK
jgi:Tol biopolymer transport system component